MYPMRAIKSTFCNPHKGLASWKRWGSCPSDYAHDAVETNDRCLPLILCDAVYGLQNVQVPKALAEISYCLYGSYRFLFYSPLKSTVSWLVCHFTQISDELVFRRLLAESAQFAQYWSRNRVQLRKATSENIALIRKRKPIKGLGIGSFWRLWKSELFQKQTREDNQRRGLQPIRQLHYQTYRFGWMGPFCLQGSALYELCGKILFLCRHKNVSLFRPSGEFPTIKRNPAAPSTYHSFIPDLRHAWWEIDTWSIEVTQEVELRF